MLERDNTYPIRPANSPAYVVPSDSNSSYRNRMYLLCGAGLSILFLGISSLQNNLKLKREMDELRSNMPAIAMSFDSNHDGVLDKSELERFVREYGFHKKANNTHLSR